MPIDNKIRKEIIDFLVGKFALSDLQLAKDDAFFGTALAGQIPNHNSKQEFASAIITRLMQRGADDAVAYLTALKDYTGAGNQATIDAFITRINAPAPQQAAPTQAADVKSSPAPASVALDTETPRTNAVATDNQTGEKASILKLISRIFAGLIILIGAGAGISEMTGVPVLQTVQGIFSPAAETVEPDATEEITETAIAATSTTEAPSPTDTPVSPSDTPVIPMNTPQPGSNATATLALNRAMPSELREAIPSLRGENSILQQVADEHASYLSTLGNSRVDDVDEVMTFQSGDDLRGELRRAGYAGYDSATMLVFTTDEVSSGLITMGAGVQEIDLASGFIVYGYASVRSRLNQRLNTVLILGKTP